MLSCLNYGRLSYGKVCKLSARCLYFPHSPPRSGNKTPPNISVNLVIQVISQISRPKENILVISVTYVCSVIEWWALAVKKNGWPCRQIGHEWPRFRGQVGERVEGARYLRPVAERLSCWCRHQGIIYFFELTLSIFLYHSCFKLISYTIGGKCFKLDATNKHIKRQWIWNILLWHWEFSLGHNLT